VVVNSCGLIMFKKNKRCRIDFSPLTMQGKNKAFSLLFPMEAVFESYVASALAKRLPNDLRLKTQASSEYLVLHKSKKIFQLKSDLLFQHVNNSENACVFDARWKLVSYTGKSDEKSKYGLSQADFYQMFAYGHQYLKGEGELFLIYPSHEDFQEAIKHSFDVNQKLKLWIVPFDISAETPDEKRLILPYNCALKSIDNVR